MKSVRTPALRAEARTLATLTPGHGARSCKCVAYLDVPGRFVSTPNMKSGGDSDAQPEVAEKLTTALAKIGLALRSQAWHGAAARGLSPTQGQILALLDSRKGTGARLTEVAAGLGVSTPTTSDAVKALVEKGLVRKEPAKDDARAIALVLTPQGKREASRVAEWPDFLLGAVDALDDGEKETFLVGLVKMLRVLQERGQVPVSTMCVSCRFFRPFVHDDSAKPHHCDFVDAAFGPSELRMECAEHEVAPPEQREETWIRFSRKPIAAVAP